MADIDDDDDENRRQWERMKPMVDIMSIVNAENPEENVKNILAALEKEDVLTQHDLTKAKIKGLKEALNKWLNETRAGNNAAATAAMNEYIIAGRAKDKDENGNVIVKPEDTDTRKKLRRSLANMLINQENCSFDISINMPDLGDLVAENYHDDTKDRKREQVAAMLKDEMGKRHLSAREISLYQSVIAAYSSDNWTTEIKKLNDLVETKEDILAAFDIATIISVEKRAKHYEKKFKTDIFGPIDPPNPPHNDQILDGYTSDEWMQLSNVAEKTAFNAGQQLEEGIIVTSLKEVLGDKYPKDFKDMTLDAQENFIKSLDPLQTAKLNVAVTQKAQGLAEMLPPHLITFMAENIDEQLKNKKTPEDLKKTLQEQRGVLIKAMGTQVAAHADNEFAFELDNIAGVYDGAKEMCAYLKKLGGDDLRLLPQEIKTQIERLETKLETSIKQYDEANHLTGINDKSAKKLEKNYDVFSQVAKDITDEDKFLKSIEADQELVNLFKKIEFPESTNGSETVSAQKNKELFIHQIVSRAIQTAAVKNVNGEMPKDLKKAINEQIQETALEEIILLYGANEAVKPLDNRGFKPTSNDKEEQKKQLLQYLQTSGEKITVSDKVLAGYFAARVNAQSLFANRLAGKDHLKDRGAKVIEKMCKPFQKLDKTCIKRFGPLYTVPKAIFKSQLNNLPWSIGNAVARVAAFSQVAMPWGAACVAGYAAFSLGSTAFRMIRQYKKMKKENLQTTVGKYLASNWSGIALSVVGTAVSVVPGLAAASELPAFQDACGWMKDAGLLEKTTLPLASDLGFTNASVVMTGVGLADSTIRGTIAGVKSDKGFFKSFGLSLINSTLNSAAGIATGMGCAYAANEVLPPNMGGFNAASDARTLTISDASYDPNNPDHHLGAPLTEEAIVANLGEDGVKYQQITDALESGDLSKTDVDAKVAELTKLLNEHGMQMQKDENGNIITSWDEVSGEKASAESIKDSERIVKYWTSADKEVYNKNIAALETAVEAYNKDHPDHPLDAHRAYHALLLSGAQAVNADRDTLTEHVNGDMDNSHARPVRGDHHAFTDKWVETHCKGTIITPALMDHLHDNIANADGLIDPAKLTPDTLQALSVLEHRIGPDGVIGDVVEARGGAHTDGYLHRNTTPNASGEHVHTEKGGKLYNTYADFKDDREPITNEVVEKYEARQASETVYMPHNPTVMLFKRAMEKIGLARIMGNNGKSLPDSAIRGQGKNIQMPAPQGRA